MVSKALALPLRVEWRAFCEDVGINDEFKRRLAWPYVSKLSLSHSNPPADARSTNTQSHLRTRAHARCPPWARTWWRHPSGVPSDASASYTARTYDGTTKPTDPGQTKAIYALIEMNVRLLDYSTDIPRLRGNHPRYLYGPGSILVAGTGSGCCARATRASCPYCPCTPRRTCRRTRIFFLLLTTWRGLRGGISRRPITSSGHVRRQEVDGGNLAEEWAR